MNIHGQYFTVDTNGGPRSVLLRGTSVVLRGFIEQNKRQQRADEYFAEHPHIENEVGALISEAAEIRARLDLIGARLYSIQDGMPDMCMRGDVWWAANAISEAIDSMQGLEQKQ